MDSSRSKKMVVVLSFMNVLTALGFGRFLYSLTIPYIHETLKFSFTQIGQIGGFIIFGYLVFSYLGGIISHQFGEKPVALVTLVFLATSFLMFYQFKNFILLCFAAFIMGASAATLYVNIFQTIHKHFDKKEFGRKIGIILSGAGCGIFLISLFVYLLYGKETSINVHLAWVVAAIITIILIPLNAFLKLEDKELPKINKKPKKITQYAKIWKILITDSIFRNLTIAYTLFGFSYASFTNYLVAYTSEISNNKMSFVVWIIFGFCSMLSSCFWGRWIDRSKKIQILFYNYAIIVIAITFSVLTKSINGLLISSALFGLCFFGYLTVFGQIIVGKTKELSSVFMGKITLLHASGQILGIYMGGLIRDYTSSFRLVFLIALIVVLMSFFFYYRFFMNAKKVV